MAEYSYYSGEFEGKHIFGNLSTLLSNDLQWATKFYTPRKRHLTVFKLLPSILLQIPIIV